MVAEPSRDWSVFKQIFAEHWDACQHAHPRYQTSYYDGLVAKMLACGSPDQIGYIEYRCLHCGQGTHRVAMSCKSSLCLRCAKVYVDNWVSQVSQMLHAGVIYRHIILTVPAMFRTTFYHNAPLLLSAFTHPSPASMEGLKAYGGCAVMPEIHYISAATAGTRGGLADPPPFKIYVGLRPH